MKIWKGYIYQVPSGTLEFGRLPRDSSCFEEVFAHLTGQELESHGKLWRASMIANNETWIFAAIGNASIDEDEDQWDRRTGWILSADRSQHASRLLLHKPTKTLFIEHNAKVSNSPRTITARLQTLLNNVLDQIDENVSWVFRLGAELDVREFDDRFDNFSRITEIEIHVSLPNESLDEPLKELLGISGEAGAEDVSFDLSSKNGINPDSHFVIRSRQLLHGFLAWIRARGQLSDGSTDSIRSDRLGKPIEHNIEEPDEFFSIENADKIMDTVGPIHPDNDPNSPNASHGKTN